MTKMPTPNTTIIPAFWRLGSFSLDRMNIGITRIATSVKICMAALANQTGPAGRQCLCMDSFVPDQNALTGLQKAKPLITIHRPAMMRKAINV